MTNTEPEPVEEGEPPEPSDEAGSFSAYDLQYAYGPFEVVTDLETLEQRMAAFEFVAKEGISPAAYNTLVGIDGTLVSAFEAGVLQPGQFSAFFEWLFSAQGVTTVTAAMVAGGVLLGLLDKYTNELGQGNANLEAALNPYQFTDPTFVGAPPVATVAPPPLSDNQGNTDIFPGAGPQGAGAGVARHARRPHRQKSPLNHHTRSHHRPGRTSCGRSGHF